MRKERGCLDLVCKYTNRERKMGKERGGQTERGREREGERDVPVNWQEPKHRSAGASLRSSS